MTNKEEIEREAEKFENETPYVAWINSSIYPDGRVYTKDFTEYLFQKLKERDEKRYNNKGEIIEKPKYYEQYLNGKIRGGSMAFIICEKYQKSKTAQEQIQSLTKQLEEREKVIEIFKRIEDKYGMYRSLDEVFEVKQFLEILSTLTPKEQPKK